MSTPFKPCRSVLAIGVRDLSTWQVQDAACVLVQDVNAAIELLRAQVFDLVVIDAGRVGPGAWSFIRALKTVRPEQRWLLVGAQRKRDEITARSLGTTAMIERPGAELDRAAMSLKQKRPTHETN